MEHKSNPVQFDYIQQIKSTHTTNKTFDTFPSIEPKDNSIGSIPANIKFLQLALSER